MRVFMNKETGKLYLMTWYDTNKHQFELESDFGWMKITYNPRLTVKQAVELEYEEIGAL